MPQEKEFLTEEGLQKITAELEHLRNVRRPEMATRIQGAKDLEGTIDNAEYDDAKNEQAFIEGRIMTLENIIKNAKVITHNHTSTKVEVGSTVRLSGAGGQALTYVIVGSSEADPTHGRISNESPVGKALLGHRTGDTVTVATPKGATKFKIIKVS